MTVAKRKKLKKPKNISPEIGTALEYFEDQVKIIAEHILSIDKKLTGVDGRLEAIERAVKMTNENIEIMKMDMELIKQGFKRKVDIEEFAALEKRVSKLESRL